MVECTNSDLQLLHWTTQLGILGHLIHTNCSGGLMKYPEIPNAREFC